VIDIVPIMVFLALIAGPILIARLVTGGEPIDFSSLIATVIESPRVPSAPEEEFVRWRPDLLERRSRTVVRDGDLRGGVPPRATSTPRVATPCGPATSSCRAW
jgi:hypothetical protein